MSDSLENSGYRLTKEKKETLRAAGVKLRLYSLQAVIEFAVEEFLKQHGEQSINTGLSDKISGVPLNRGGPIPDRLLAVEMAVQEVLIALSALRQPGESEKDGALSPPAPPEHPRADRPGRNKAGGQ